MADKQTNCRLRATLVARAVSVRHHSGQLVARASELVDVCERQCDFAARLIRQARERRVPLRSERPVSCARPRKRA